MAVLVALSTVLATFLGGYLALRSRNRIHLVLGLSAGLLLGLVAFDLIPEVFDLSSLEVVSKSPPNYRCLMCAKCPTYSRIRLMRLFEL